MTNEQIVNLYEGLVEIGENRDLKFKASVSFIFAKNKNLLKPFYEAAVEARQKLIEKYGQPDDNGWFIENEKLPQFKNELNALMEVNSYVATTEIDLKELEDERIGIDLMEKLLPMFKNKTR